MLPYLCVFTCVSAIHTSSIIQRRPLLSVLHRLFSSFSPFCTLLSCQNLPLFLPSPPTPLPSPFSRCTAEVTNLRQERVNLQEDISRQRQLEEKKLDLDRQVEDLEKAVEELRDEKRPFEVRATYDAISTVDTQFFGTLSDFEVADSFHDWYLRCGFKLWLILSNKLIIHSNNFCLQVFPLQISYDPPVTLGPCICPVNVSSEMILL